MARLTHTRPWLVFTAALVLAGATSAGPERVDLPANYRDTMLLYNQIERPDRKPPQVRFMYANKEAASTARAGQPAPEGTVLIMEDRKVQLDAAGQPMRSPDGRYLVTDEATNLFVQKKSAGWGDAYPPAQRNGDWEYAWFNPDGTRRANAKFEGCFACHQSRAGRDYTFTFLKWVADGKP